MEHSELTLEELRALAEEERGKREEAFSRPDPVEVNYYFI